MINESPRVTASSVEAEFEITGPVEGVRCFLRSQTDQLWRDCKPVWSIALCTSLPGTIQEIQIYTFNEKLEAVVVQ